MIYYDSSLYVPLVSDDKMSYFCQISLETIILMSDIYIYMNSWNNEIVSIHPSTIPYFNSN